MAAETAWLSVLEGTLVNDIIRKNHSADAIGLVELVDGARVFILFGFNGYTLELFLEEEINEFIFNF